MKFTLEQNGPIIAQRMRDASAPGKFSVVVCHYGGGNTAWHATTIKQAVRILGSACSSTRGKIGRTLRDTFAAALVTPDGRVMTWAECRTALRTI